jgi:signal transduction histidine kinase
MKSFFKKYLFVFEFIAVAILLAVGIYLVVDPQVFLYIVGLALIIFGLYRVIPLVKTTKDNMMKLILTGEVIINVIAGVLLVLEGAKDDYNKDLLRWVVGAVFYLRGFLYFFGTVIRKESTDYTRFFVHIGIFTLGTGILFNNFLDETVMAWIVLVLCILASIFISISGIGHYKNYRYEQLAKDETKKALEKQKEKELEEKIPLKDPKPTSDDVIIPEEEQNDEVRV